MYVMARGATRAAQRQGSKQAGGQAGRWAERWAGKRVGKYVAGAEPCRIAAITAPCHPNAPKSIQFASPPAGSPFNMLHYNFLKGLAFCPLH